jgi:hypothetical protein
MSAADSFIDLPCRSAIPYATVVSGKVCITAATRSGAVLIASSLSAGAAMSSISVISRPKVARQCAEHGPRRVAEVGPHLRNARRQAQRTQRREEDLRGEVSASALLPTLAKIVR